MPKQKNNKKLDNSNKNEVPIVKQKNNKRHKLHIYKKNDIVITPAYFYDELDRVFHFDFDPCPVDPQFDGLSIEWGSMNFVNPPFSQIGKWLKKAVEEQKKGRKSVFLITFRPNNKYWLDYIFPNCKHIYFISKGIIFQNFKRVLPIPLCLVYFDNNNVENQNQQQTKKDRYNGFTTRDMADDIKSSSISESDSTESKIYLSDTESVQVVPLLIEMQINRSSRSYQRIFDRYTGDG